jgi:hypothetical protein
MQIEVKPKLKFDHFISSFLNIGFLIIKNFIAREIKKLGLSEIIQRFKDLKLE